ncbi:outer membrane beta-barrel protein [uncultured Rhodoblastus sp.]|uniref:outer membrane protein n=1 Tax=uncultured Rhodoblastus sp. TaxID=543037 RepID=UPI0025EB443D|nr:outer membrane beta-barrel protein [uncultured Rhodoblastus sp.]
MRHLLTTLALAGLISPACAADPYSARQNPVFLDPPPYFSWSGFYIGADIGGGVANLNANSALGSFNSSASGVIGGARIGYNAQLDQLVIGLEGDFYGAGIGADKYFPDADLTLNRNQDWLAAINGHLGYAVYRTQFYALGGVAFTQGASRFTAGPSLAPLAAGLGLPTSVSVSHAYTGFDVGGGVEYGFTDNVIGRLEYRYYYFGGWNYPGNGWIQQTQASLNDNVVTLGLSYKFNVAQPPVAAKY